MIFFSCSANSAEILKFNNNSLIFKPLKRLIQVIYKDFLLSALIFFYCDLSHFSAASRPSLPPLVKVAPLRACSSARGSLFDQGAPLRLLINVAPPFPFPPRRKRQMRGGKLLFSSGHCLSLSRVQGERFSGNGPPSPHSKLNREEGGKLSRYTVW